MGARCNQPTLTFDALDGDQADKEGAGAGTGVGARSWAHVVKTGGGQSRSAGQVTNELEIQEALLKEQKEAAQAADALAAQSAKDKAARAAQDEAARADQGDAAQAEAARAESAQAEAAQAQAALDGAAVLASVELTEAEAAEAEASLFVTDNDVKNKPRKKQKIDQGGQYSDAEMASGSEKSDNFEVDPPVSGIHPLRDDILASSNAGLSGDSQGTSKAGLSFDSMATFGSGLSADSLDQNLKVIVPDANTSDSSTDSSPRPHKKAAQNKEDLNDLPFNLRSKDHSDFKSFLAAKHFDGGKDSGKDSDF